jgi:hypothetical protein
MVYSISNITQTADCDVLLAWAGNEKADLTFKKLSEERLTNKFATTSVEVDAVLQGVLVELSTIDTIIGVLPEGPTKEDEIKKKVKLEYKKFLLETRKESYGAVSLLEKQLDLARIEKQLEELDTFVATVSAHKDTL